MRITASAEVPLVDGASTPEQHSALRVRQKPQPRGSPMKIRKRRHIACNLHKSGYPWRAPQASARPRFSRTVTRKT